MAIYDPAAIRAAIKTLIQTAVGTDIAFVYDFDNPNVEGYPAIIFDISGEDNEMMDDSNNMRKITFTIYVMVEIKVITLEVATDILDNAVKAITNLVEKKSNNTLSNTVDWVTPVIGKRQQTNSPDGNLIWQEMQLRCNIASSIL